jgi:hypothetical protein
VGASRWWTSHAPPTIISKGGSICLTSVHTRAFTRRQSSTVSAVRVESGLCQLLWETCDVVAVDVVAADIGRGDTCSNRALMRCLEVSRTAWSTSTWVCTSLDESVARAAPKKATPKIPKSAVKVCDCGVEGHRSPYPTVVKHVTVKYKASTTVQVGSRTQ